MLSATDLIVGRLYFTLAYEDEELTRLFIHSLEYRGIQEDAECAEPRHVFRIVGGNSLTAESSEQAPKVAAPQAGDEMFVFEKQLDLIHTFEGLASELIRLSPTNGAWVYK